MTHPPNQGSKKVKGVADMVFLIDASGSMTPCITALKNNINIFIKSLTETNPNNQRPIKQWRAKVFGYRDDDIEPFVDNPFISTVKDFEKQLDNLEAKGGYFETPEPLLDALYKIATMGQTEEFAESSPYKWKNRHEASRVVIIFTDEPYQENLSTVPGASVDDVITAIESSRIYLSIFAPEMECYDILSEADRAEYEAISGENPQEALEQFTSDQTNFRKTMEMLAKTVAASIPAPKL